MRGCLLHGTKDIKMFVRHVENLRESKSARFARTARDSLFCLKMTKHQRS